MLSEHFDCFFFFYLKTIYYKYYWYLIINVFLCDSHIRYNVLYPNSRERNAMIYYNINWGGFFFFFCYCSITSNMKDIILCTLKNKTNYLFKFYKILRKKKNRYLYCNYELRVISLELSIISVHKKLLLTFFADMNCHN